MIQLRSYDSCNLETDKASWRKKFLKLCHFLLSARRQLGCHQNSHAYFYSSAALSSRLIFNDLSNSITWMMVNRHCPPYNWCTYQRNDFNEPRLLHLPIHRKTLNFLTWDIWFSLINSDLLMFWLPVLWLQKILHILVPPLLLQNNSVLIVIWDAVSCGSSPQKIYWVKHNSQLLGCTFIFFFSVDNIKSRTKCYTTVSLTLYPELVYWYMVWSVIPFLKLDKVSPFLTHTEVQSS